MFNFFSGNPMFPRENTFLIEKEAMTEVLVLTTAILKILGHCRINPEVFVYFFIYFF